MSDDEVYPEVKDAVGRVEDAMVLGGGDWNQVPEWLKTMEHSTHTATKLMSDLSDTVRKFVQTLQDGQLPEMGDAEDALVAARSAAERAGLLNADAERLATTATNVQNGANTVAEGLEAVIAAIRNANSV